MEDTGETAMLVFQGSCIQATSLRTMVGSRWSLIAKTLLQSARGEEAEYHVH